MRIALLNNRYFMVGGTTRYLFNIEKLLASQGHQVIPFSNRFPQTVPTPYIDYFVDPPGGKDAAVFFQDSPMTLRRAGSLFIRGVYDLGVRKKLERMIDAERIDLVYSINICNFLGPSVIDAARSRGVPYVLRLSDFNLSCPSYLHLREGRPCEDCRTSLWNAVRHKCLQDSRSVSLARVLAMWTHRMLRIYEKADFIVTPSAFLRSRVTALGFAENRVVHIPTFVDLEAFCPSGAVQNPEIVYTGRLAPEKGPELLIRAVGLVPESSPLRLVFVGDGDPNYVKQLKAMAAQIAPHRISFLGFLRTEELRRRVEMATALALPARWFENMPNSISEAMAMGKPVLTTPLGSLAEQVVDGETGYLLDVDDPRPWAAVMERLVRDPALATRLGSEGRRRAEKEFSATLHLSRLSEVFDRAAGQSSTNPKAPS